MAEIVKSNGGVGYIVVAIIVGAVPEVIVRWIDRVDPAQTQVALAKLELQVSELKEQVKALNGQPYVRRDEFESRTSRLDDRVSDLERLSKPRR